MATIEKRGPYQFRAKNRKKGFKPVSRTFTYLKDAREWAKQKESEMERGLYFDTTEAENTSLFEALERYAREITSQKKGAYAELPRIRAWQRYPIAQCSLSTIRGKDMAAFREQRLAEGKAVNTIRNELKIISHLYTVAQKEWGMESLSNPVKLIRLPQGAQVRDRRLEGDEEERLLDVARKTRSRMIEPIIILALETAARRGEIVSMEWKYIDLNNQTWFLPETKNGSSRTVPLSTRAIAVLRKIKKEPTRIDGRVFFLKPHSISQAFRRCCKAAKIEDLHFHDLRHEATSRFFELGLNMMEVASITGHKDLKMLKRYTHLRAEDLAAKLG